MMPSQRNMKGCFDEIDSVLDFLPDVKLLGPASGFFSSSFNDQVLQGLKLGEEL